MKTKTWTVITNTGQQADLAFNTEKKEVQRPTHITAKEFIHWLEPKSHVDDSSLRSLFKLSDLPAGARTAPPAK
jgi:hypothetical protein